MNLKKVPLWAVVILLFTSVAFSQDQPAIETDPDEQVRLDEQTNILQEEPTANAWRSNFRNPTPWLEMGADIRIRSVYAENIHTLQDANPNNKWAFQRYRLRWWTKSELTEDIDFNTRLTWESRTWHHRGDRNYDIDEALFDRFNITMRNLFDQPITAVIGRQDIILGKGWLVLEGTPLDGSRTIHFDALRLTYDWKTADTLVDLIYIHQDADTESWLPVINDRNKKVTQQDQKAGILYVTNKSLENTQIEGYAIAKDDRGTGVGNSVDAEVYTFGGALSGKLFDSENWGYRTEHAFQVGKREGRDLRTFGSKNELSYSFNDKYENSLHLAYEYLSGDDPDSTKDEQFDPLWGHWPQFSELYVYTYIPETRIAETTNLHRLGFGHRFKPHPKWQVLSDYHLLWADENTFRDQGFFSQSGNFRGQLFTLWLRYTHSPQLSAHFVGEYLVPGNYYADQNRDDAFFLRVNLEYTF